MSSGTTDSAAHSGDSCGGGGGWDEAIGDAGFRILGRDSAFALGRHLFRGCHSPSRPGRGHSSRREFAILSKADRRPLEAFHYWSNLRGCDCVARRRTKRLVLWLRQQRRRGCNSLLLRRNTNSGMCIPFSRVCDSDPGERGLRIPRQIKTPPSPRPVAAPRDSDKKPSSSGTAESGRAAGADSCGCAGRCVLAERACFKQPGHPEISKGLPANSLAICPAGILTAWTRSPNADGSASVSRRS